MVTTGGADRRKVPKHVSRTVCILSAVTYCYILSFLRGHRCHGCRLFDESKLRHRYELSYCIASQRERKKRKKEKYLNRRIPVVADYGITMHSDLMASQETNHS